MRPLHLLLLSVAVLPWAPALASPETPSRSFSFAILADPHIHGSREHDRRLRAAVRWINDHRREKGIELVFILGDLAYGRGQALRARAMLTKLQVPWFPLIGDNEIVSGWERAFHAGFADRFRRLGETLDTFRRGPTPVRDPASGRRLFLQNFALTHGGVRFVGLDWATRNGGESADLHDFPGGTYRWLEAELKGLPEGPAKGTILLSHHPMHRNILFEVFTREERDRLTSLLKPHASEVYANFAGHYHANLRQRLWSTGIDIFVTDATFDGKNTIRLVKVTPGEKAFTYAHEFVEVEP